MANGWTIEASFTTSCVKEESVVEGCTKFVVMLALLTWKLDLE